MSDFEKNINEHNLELAKQIKFLEIDLIDQITDYFIVVLHME